MVSKLCQLRTLVLFITAIMIIYFILYLHSNVSMTNASLEQINKPQSEPLQTQIIEPMEAPIAEPLSSEPTGSPTKSPIKLQYINWSAYTEHRNWRNKTTDIIPSSWQKLSDQQFCRIPENATNLKKFLQFIHKAQFGRDCNDPNHQFVIYDIKLEAGNGLGASLLGNLKRYFAASLMLNRTFVLTGAYDWSFDRPYCQGKGDGMECYFLPVSNCNAVDILQSIITDNNDPNSNPYAYYYKGTRPKHCIFGNNVVANPNLTHCTHRIIHIDTNDPHYVLLNGEIREWIHAEFDIGMMEYEAMIPAFFLRPQPTVRDIVYNKIHKSMRASGRTFQLGGAVSTNRMIAYPIRASDKCNSIHTMTGKQYTHKSESECFTPEEHVKVMNSIKYLTDGLIRTVILTSEDSSFLDRVVEVMKNKEISDVDGWNIIRNTEDFSVGEGTTTYKNTVKTFNVSLDEGSGTSLERDHIVSALSSMVFQVHLEPKYIVYGDSSTWLKLMWKWLVFLNCNIRSEFHVMDDAKCIELSTPGYLHYYGQFPYKFVRYSEELWQRIRDENLTPDRFVERFGINITKFGWDRYCEKDFKKKDKF